MFLTIRFKLGRLDAYLVLDALVSETNGTFFFFVFAPIYSSRHVSTLGSSLFSTHLLIWKNSE